MNCSAGKLVLVRRSLTVTRIVVVVVSTRALY